MKLSLGILVCVIGATALQGMEKKPHPVKQAQIAPLAPTELEQFTKLVQQAVKLAESKMLPGQISEKLRQQFNAMDDTLLITITQAIHSLHDKTILTAARQAWRDKMIRDTIRSKKSFQKLVKSLSQLPLAAQISLAQEDPALIELFPPQHNQKKYGSASNILTFDNNNNLLVVHSLKTNPLKQLITWNPSNNQLLKKSTLDASISCWTLDKNNSLVYATINGITMQTPFHTQEIISSQKYTKALTWMQRLLVSSDSDIIAVHQRQTSDTVCEWAQVALFYQKRVHTLHANVDQHLIAVNAERVKIWDITTQTCARQIDYPSAPYITFDISSDGTMLLGAASGTHDISLYDLQTKERKNLPQKAIDIAFSSDNKLILIIGSNNSVRIWNHAANSIVTVLPHEKEVRKVLISSDNSTVYTLSGKNDIALWDTYSGKKLYTFEQPNSQFIKNILLSNDNSVLTCDRQINLLSFWNVKKLSSKQLNKLNSEHIPLIALAAQYKHNHRKISLHQYPYLKKAHKSLPKEFTDTLPFSTKRKYNHRIQIIHD